MSTHDEVAADLEKLGETALRIKRERDFLLHVCKECYRALGPEPDPRLEDLLNRAIEFAEESDE